jgi:hypothetical protein
MIICFCKILSDCNPVRILRCEDSDNIVNPVRFDISTYMN